MAGDGVSLQTNIAQLGRVAKTQSQNQQGTTATPHQAPQKKEEAQPLQHVREGEKTTPEELDPRRHKRRGRDRDDARQEADAAAEDADAGAEDHDDDDEAPPWLGGLVDTKA